MLATPAEARPRYLVPLTDPVLGTTTTRVSSTSGVRQNYSRISAWNRDGSKILLGFTYPGRMLDGRTYADLGELEPKNHGVVWKRGTPKK